MKKNLISKMSFMVLAMSLAVVPAYASDNTIAATPLSAAIVTTVTASDDTNVDSMIEMTCIPVLENGTEGEAIEFTSIEDLEKLNLGQDGSLSFKIIGDNADGQIIVISKNDTANPLIK